MEIRLELISWVQFASNLLLDNKKLVIGGRRKWYLDREYSSNI